MAQVKLAFFFDIVSPYSYVGFKLLQRNVALWKEQKAAVAVEYRPFFLGGVMQMTNNKPPATLPAKGVFMFADLTRSAQLLDIVVNMPANFPPPTLPAMRLLAAVDGDSVLRDKYFVALTEALFERVFVTNEDVSDVASLQEACKACGIPSDVAGTLLASISSQEIKEKVKKATEEAVSKGAFGSPTIIINDDQLFFGSDRFEQICALYDLPYSNHYVKKNKDGSKL